MCFNEGREWNSDTARLINKFDVYICELGDPGDSNTLGKTRPCVIISSNDINDPRSGQYMIAPIRTEHTVMVTDENVEYIVAEKFKLGRMYVPVLMDGYRFIDVTQSRQVPSSKILNYKGTIINPDVRTRLNNSLMRLLFSTEELNKFANPINDTEVAEPMNLCNHLDINGESAIVRDSDGIVSCKICGDQFKDFSIMEKGIEEPNKEEIEIVEDDQLSEYEENETKRSKKKKSGTAFPLGFSKYYELYKKDKITISQLAKKLNKGRSTVYYYLKKYEELHPELVTK